MQHRPSLADRVQHKLLQLVRISSTVIASAILRVRTALTTDIRRAGSNVIIRAVQSYGRLALTIIGVMVVALVRLLGSTITGVSDGLWQRRRILLAVSATCAVSAIAAIWLPHLSLESALPPPSVTMPIATAPIVPERLTFDFQLGGTSPNQRLGQSISLALAAGDNSELVAAGMNTVLIFRPDTFSKTWEPVWSYPPPGDNIGGSDPLAVSIEDIDASGSFDLIVGAPAFSNGSESQATGAVLIFLDPLDRLNNKSEPSTPDVIIVGGEPGSRFGLSVAGVGDVNADGYEDILVGAPYAAQEAGAAFLYSGAMLVDVGPQRKPYRFAWSKGQELRPKSTMEPGARFGLVIGGGDIDGDSVPELLVSAPGTSQCRGAVYLFRIDSEPFESRDPLQANWLLQGEQPGEQFGYATAFIENPSSRDLLAVGGPGYVEAPPTADRVAALPKPAGPACLVGGLQQGEGRVAIYNDLDLVDGNKPSDTIVGWQNGMQLGSALYDIGDLNQDLEHDLLVGAIGFDESGGEGDVGAVALYMSASTSPFSAEPYWQIAGPRARIGFATALAGGEFVPGVGLVILVGAPNYSPKALDGNNEGGLLLYVVNKHR